MIFGIVLADFFEPESGLSITQHCQYRSRKKVLIAVHQSDTAATLINDKEKQMSGQAIENEIQAKGLTAPRITPADIEANIKQEIYFTPADAIRFAYLTSDPDCGDERARKNSIIDCLPTRSYSGACIDIDANTEVPVSTKLLTFCVLVLKNGFTVTGESSCASPENFDAELGRKIARQHAISKVWPLMGYELRSKLAAPIGHAASIGDAA